MDFLIALRAIYHVEVKFKLQSATYYLSIQAPFFVHIYIYFHVRGYLQDVSDDTTWYTRSNFGNVQVLLM